MIISKENQTIKLALKLKLKKYRDQLNQFLVYGDHLIEEAKKHGKVLMIITSNPQKEGLLIAEDLMKQLSMTPSPHDILAICQKQEKPAVNPPRVLVLDDIQDPGNLGALIRSALAFGFTHLIMSPNTVDLYNEKVIRSTQGALFQISYEKGNLTQILTKYHQQGYLILGADPHQSSVKISTNQPIIICLGNEAQGLSPDTQLLLDGYLSIKTQKVESLNVSIAGAILMYEYQEE